MWTTPVLTGTHSISSIGASTSTTPTSSSSTAATPMAITSTATNNKTPVSNLSSQTNNNSNSKSNSTSSTSSNLLEYFIAGGAAGAMSRTVVSPLERLKIIFQCQGPGSAHYQGMWPSLIKIGKEEGWRGYFRGNGINVIRIAPYSAIQFSSYEIAKKILSRLSTTGELTTPLRLGAGAFAGICSVVSTYPLDLVRSRLSIISASIGTPTPMTHSHNTNTVGRRSKEMGMIEMMVEIYKKEGGVRGLYRGLIPTVIGVAPYVGSNFAAYEFLKQYFCPPITISSSDPSPTGSSSSSSKQSNHGLSVLRKLACGALAGAFSQTITYPLDVLRRRMQVTGMSNMEFQYNGAWDATLKIVKKEGFRGLYKGLWPNFLKVAPSIGTSFVTYELVRDYLLSI